MKPPCAARAAAPAPAGTWWSTPPAWPASPSPRAVSNRRAAPCTTVRVPTVDLADRRAATAATAVDEGTAVGVATGADPADRAVRAQVWQFPVGQVGNLRADCESAQMGRAHRPTPV